MFKDVLDAYVAAYLDDILIFSNTWEEHQEHVKEVLRRLRKHKLYAKIDKCLFHASSVEFLGYNVSPDRVSMDTSKTDSIRAWPTPGSVKEIQSFLGFANFYRRFIANYSGIVQPLTRLTRKDVPFLWDSSAQSAFDSLKSAFTSAPILRHFHPDRQTIVETDASDYAIAAILSQVDPETQEIHPVTFHSRTMAPAELNYEIYDKELLAIFAAFKSWRSFLEGSSLPVQVITDHKNLEYFSTTKLLTRRQARWSEFLSGFAFDIRYRPGRLGGKPDALTRRPDVYPKRGDGGYALANPQNLQTLFKHGQLLTSLRATFFFHVSLRAVHLIDAEVLLSDIKEGLPLDSFSKGHLPDPSAPYSTSETGLLLHEGRIYVPDYKDLRLRILRDRHDHPTAGHFGYAKTLDLVRREFFWPDMRKFILNYCSSCTSCARAKSSCHQPYGLLKPLPIPERPWNSISMDLIEQLPESDGYSAILVIVDRLTKMSLFLPTTNSVTAEDIARLFVTHVFSKHGVPSDVVSDRGTEFTSNFWRSLGTLLEMKLNFSTAYHPQSDGQTERTNQTLEQYLRLYCNYRQDNWAELLPMAEFAYNNSSHSSSNTTPFFANYGYHPSITVSSDKSVPSPEAHDFSRQISELHAYLKTELKTAQDQYIRSANQLRTPAPPFEVGQEVWLNAKNIRTTRPTKKLDYRKLGPFRIVEKISSHAFKLGLPLSLKRIHPVFHVSLLEPVTPNTIPNRVPDPPPPVILPDGSEPEYEVAQILDSRFRWKKLFYFVQWRGYEDNPTENSWEPAENLVNASEAINDFHFRNPDKPRP